MRDSDGVAFNVVGPHEGTGDEEFKIGEAGPG